MAATPRLLVDALAEHARNLRDLTVLQLHLEGAEALVDPELFGKLKNRIFFASAPNR
jgi:hypothetical protein